MGWIGLRQDNAGTFRPGGLDAVLPPQPTDPDAVLPRGTLACEFVYLPARTRTNIIRFSARIPWASSLSVCVDPDGTAHLFVAQHGAAQAISLRTTLGQTPQTAIATFGWDAPARRAVFSVYLPETGALHLTDMTPPPPLSHRDAGRMVTDPGCCATDPAVVWLALSDQIEPIGPTAGFGATAVLDTPEGPRPIHRLEPGQRVMTADGGTAQIRWAGWQDLPARGCHTPLLIRAPYFGLTADLLVAPSQRLRLKGSEVEYLFGEEEVSAAAAHLFDGRAIVRAPAMQTVRYHQIVLDRPAILLVSGAAMEAFDIGALQADPDLLPYSLLAAMPRELLPRAGRSPLPMLRAFEAVTLAATRAA